MIKNAKVVGEFNFSNAKKLIIAGIVVVIAVVVLLASITIVPAGHTGVVVTLGKVSSNVLSEGFHFKAPLVQNVVKMSNQIQKCEIEGAESVSKDLQAISTTIVVNYKIGDSSSAKIYREIGRDYETIMLMPAIHESLKAVTAKYTAEQLVTSRSQVAIEIQDTLAEKMEEYGIVIEKFNIVNFSFSEEFSKAIEAKEVAQQNLLKAKTEQEQLIVEANAQAEKKVIAAEAEAKAILRKAEAQAEANEKIEKSLSKNVLENKTMQVHKNDRILVVNGIVFPDKSCEITIEDITEKEERALLKRQLTQNISHELKTPVSSIQGFMETIINNPDLDEAKRNFFIERCHAQSVRLSYLLQDISMLNKLDEGSGIFDRDDIDVKAVVESVLSDVSLELEEKNIQTQVSIPSPLIIKGNMSLLYSIFRNLVDNTLHYAGNNIEIHISCFRVDNDFLHFSYADTGIGVESKHLNHLFDRFYRVDKGRSRKLGGTGLGLAIVKNAIAFHNGRISAKHHPKGGLEFVFSLRKEPVPTID